MTLEEIYEAAAFDPRDRRGGTMNRPTWADGLLGVSACDESIAALEAVVGDLDAPMPCSWAWALVVLSSPGLPTREYVGRGVGRLVDPCDVGVVAGADLRGASLAGADITRASLCDADLRDANLRGADLRGADMYGAILAGASPWSANLTGANLADANLARANLDGARRDPSDPSIAGWVVVDGRLRRATP